MELCFSHKRIVLTTVIGLMFMPGCWQSVRAADLPAAASPGGAIPREWLRPVPSTKPDVLEIPVVKRRPTDEEAGASVLVRSIAIEGITLGPAQGIHVDEIRYIVASVREALPPELTIAQLQRVADAVTAYYRRAGYVLARAIIPAQQVENGSVIIRVLEGVLGRVMIEGNQSYSSGQLTSVLKNYRGHPVKKEHMESALLRLTDYPGLDVFGVFGPGIDVGTTDLTLKVQQESLFEVDLGLDNYGTEYTGEYRVRTGLKWNNVTRSADRLDFTLYQTVRPDNSLYGDISYQRPIHSSAYSFGLAASNHAFEVGKELAPFDIEGDTRLANAFLRKQFVRTRHTNIYGLAELARKNASIKSISTDRVDDLAVLSIEAGYDSYGGRGINQAVLRVSHGFNDLLGAMDADGDGRSSRVGGSGEVSGGQFDKLAFQYARMQYLSSNQSLLLRANGQYSSDLLVSIEQLGMGGPNNVRAYGVSEFLQDKLVFLSAEWILDAPGFADKSAFGHHNWGEILKFSLFVDWSKGRLNDALANEIESVTLAGAGIGMQLRLPGQMLARLDIATPIGNQPYTDTVNGVEAPANGRDPQILFSLNYQLDI